MFAVQVPEGATPGTTIQAQSPFGNILQVQVPQGVAPGQTFQVVDPGAPQTVGAPQQQMMGAAGGDLFRGAGKVLVKQEMAAIELCGIEAKQRYRISMPEADNREGQVFLYITEESECLERICCSVNRSLTMKVHHGSGKEGPVGQTMHKPFSCQGCCFLRPNFTVNGPGGISDKIGEIDDPCRCCYMDQRVFDTNQNHIFTTGGSICQGGMFCPLCCGVDFDVKRGGVSVAHIQKMPLSCEEACLKTNRFMIDFGNVTDAKERRLLLGSAMLLDLEYFESQK